MTQQYQFLVDCLISIGLATVTDQYCLVAEDQVINQVNGDKFIELYQQHQKPLLLFLDSNPFSNAYYYNILKICDQINVPVKIFSGNALHFFEGNKQLIYYPAWFFQQRQQRNFQKSKKNKKYRFSFLSNQPRFHRLYLYQLCKSYISDQDCFAVSLNNFASQKSHLQAHVQEHLGSAIDITVDLPFASTMAKDRYYKSLTRNSTVVDYSNRHPAYQAMINITGESGFESDQVFITEKTWKPIRSKCLTITYGNEHTVDVLKRFGFQSNQLLDQDDNIVNKAQMIADQMQSYSYEDCCKIYQHSSKILQHNMERFYGDDVVNMFVTHIENQLK